MAYKSLKSVSVVRQNLKFTGVDKASFKARFKNEAKASDHPTVYGTNESYVQINELGPVVDDLIDGVTALEVEVTDIVEYLEGMLGLNSTDVSLPAVIKVFNGTTYNTIIENGVWVGPSSGIKGDRGAQGAQGARGANGSSGSSGTSGSSGSSGNDGSKGQKGQKGDTGARGAAGANGSSGSSGTSGSSGSSGTSGVNGAQGARGAHGPQGDKGKTGARG